MEIADSYLKVVSKIYEDNALKAGLIIRAKKGSQVIKNIKGSSEVAPECPTCHAWINPWENIVKRAHIKPILICSEQDCQCTDFNLLVGAHVKLNDGKASEWWIVPLGNKHNNPANVALFQLKLGTVMVSANTWLIGYSDWLSKGIA